METAIKKKHSGVRFLIVLVFLTALGVVLNVVSDWSGSYFGVRVFAGNLGTVIASVFGGALPGILSAVISSAIMSLFSGNLLFYSSIGSIIALFASFFAKKGYFSKISKLIFPFLVFAVTDGVLRAPLMFFLDSGGGYSSAIRGFVSEKLVSDPFLSVFVSCFIEALINAFVITLLTALILRLVPKGLRDRVADALHVRASTGRKIGKSLLSKVISVVLIAGVALGSIAYSLGYVLYREASIKKYTEICQGVAKTASLAIDAERVPEYIEKGMDADGYAETENKLYGIMNNFSQVMYLYSYRIEPDVGCRVVFDLDVEGTEGSEVGSVVPFDESFTDLLPKLFAGEKIDPIITNDTYGWLLTVYNPVYNSNGECVCYVAADVSMSQIIDDEVAFVIKLVALFASFTVLIMAIVLELFKIRIIYPINDIAGAADEFAYETEEGRKKSLERLRTISVNTNDEIFDLHAALCRMAEDSGDYIDRIRVQSALIAKLRDDIIIDFAEMVEARDKSTGDHIKKTARYVEAIARELQKEGKYPEDLTDEFIARLVRSAPLHDIGKIKVSDVILNKPGRLTDEEYSMMKMHTVEGKNILANSSAMADSEGYLKEAIEMANYHHEKWDGSGYPCGVKGEDIPLSARIMAVADVFDALASERSYKKPFPIDEALKIIKEGSGKHFDPVVVDAFLNIAEETFKASSAVSKKNEPESGDDEVEKQES